MAAHHSGDEFLKSRRIVYHARFKNRRKALGQSKMQSASPQDLRPVPPDIYDQPMAFRSYLQDVRDGWRQFYGMRSINRIEGVPYTSGLILPISIALCGGKPQY